MIAATMIAERIFDMARRLHPAPPHRTTESDGDGRINSPRVT